jgi:hypothetical protein
VTPTETLVDALRAAGCDPKPSGVGWASRCPAHDDRAPSLTIGTGDDGRALVKCHRGCEPTAILAAVGLTLADLFEDRKAHRGGIVAVYDYLDEGGRLLFQVVRYAGKAFRQRRPDGNGGWVWNLHDTRRVLYHLPALLEACSRGAVVFVVEGERDVEAVESADGIATTNPGGAKAWRAEYAQWLAGASEVVIVADRDPEGYRHAVAVAASLNGQGYRIVQAATGKDVADHLAAGHGLEDFDPVPDDVLNAGATTTDDGTTGRFEPPRVVLRPASAFGRRAVRWLPGYEGFFPMGMLSVLVGFQGDGKTLIVCLIAANESQHGRSVVIASTEDEIESVLRPRLEAAGADLDRVSFVGLRTPTGDDDLYLPDHGVYLVDAIEAARPSLLVVDPMEAFVGSHTDSWKSPDMRRALRPISACAERAGCAAIVVGYMNRGASARFLERVAESMAVTRASRSAVLLWPDPEDPDGSRGSRRILALGKTNLAPRGTQARCYDIQPVVLPHVAASPANGIPADLEQVTTARIVFTGYREVSADQLIARTKADTSSDRTDKAVAEALLLALLGEGDEVPQARIVQAGERFGVSERTLQRALRALEGESRKQGRDEGWTWRLPGRKGDD